MNATDIHGFFADEAEINKEEYVVFTYIFETAIDPFEAAAKLCRESSTAQWKRPGIDEDFREKHGARVLDIETIEDAIIPTFNVCSKEGSRFSRARVRIAHPHRNFGAKIPNLLTVAMGEGAFFCDDIGAIKLIDIEFPASYLAEFQGPQFGAQGIRNILEVYDRPLFFGVVKPNVGLDPAGFANIAREAWEGGLDAAKDDEMLADPEYSPFAERMKLVGRAMKEACDSTGEKKMFIANITDETDRLAELYDIACANGINAVMVNVMAVGLSAVRALRKISRVPIVAHFDCIAPMSRHPGFGVSTTVMTKLQRLCGCDAIIMPGFGARMMTPDEEVIANAVECTSPMGDIKPALPVPGGSDWAGTLPLVYEKLRTLDFAMVPGRGVFNHPMGPRAGAASFRQAWEAVINRVKITDLAAERIELAKAIESFGSKDNFYGTQAKPDGAILSWVIRGFTGASINLAKN